MKVILWDCSKTAWLLCAALLCLASAGCKEKEIKEVKKEEWINDMQAEILPEDKYFDVELEDSTRNIEQLPECRIERVAQDEIKKYWIRYYRGKTPGQKDNRIEYRFKGYEDDYLYEKNYLIVKQNAEKVSGKAIYIKWYNYSETKDPGKYKYSTDDIGKQTKYLETNLPAETIRKYFPEVEENRIRVVKPKLIKVDMTGILPVFWSENTIDYEFVY